MLVKNNLENFAKKSYGKRLVKYEFKKSKYDKKKLGTISILHGRGFLLLDGTLCNGPCP